jgi:hypothetical protein
MKVQRRRPRADENDATCRGNKRAKRKQARKDRHADGTYVVSGRCTADRESEVGCSNPYQSKSSWMRDRGGVLI